MSGVRLGAGRGEGAAARLGDACTAMAGTFLGAVGEMTRPRQARVMLADATVTSQSTFDPGAVHSYMGQVASLLGGWTARGPEYGGGGGTRRLFVRLEAEIPGYVVGAHLAIQYHALLYYRPEQRVVECQRELERLAASAEEAQRRAASRGDEAAREGLGAAGDGGVQEIFEALYNDEDLLGRVSGMADGAAGGGAGAILDRRKSLLAELDSHLVETYGTEQVLIDEARLATGEEGAAFSVDLEGDGLPGITPSAERDIGALLDALADALGRARV